MVSKKTPTAQMIKAAIETKDLVQLEDWYKQLFPPYSFWEETLLKRVRVGIEKISA